MEEEHYDLLLLAAHLRSEANKIELIVSAETGLSPMKIPSE
jgi:hypothetical protein